MQNAGYMRLKNLQLGYSLPKSVVEKVGISNCRVFVSGENLLTFTSLSSIFDPETCVGGWGGNAYPLSSTWSFGLSVPFNLIINHENKNIFLSIDSYSFE